MKNRIICWLLSAVMVFSPCLTAWASPVETVSVSVNDLPQETAVSDTEPVSADSVQLSSGGYASLNDGYIPGKVHAENELDADMLGALGAADSLSYVPVGEAFLPKEYEDQKSTNLCWAYAQAMACEISAKKAELLDPDSSLSAAHLGYFFYNLGEDVEDPNGNLAGEYTRPVGVTDWTKAPGNARLSMWELAQWLGLVSYDKDMDSAYDNSRLTGDEDKATLLNNDTDTAYLDDAVHVDGVYMAGLDADKRIDVKTLIYNLGAVNTGYYTANEYDSFAQSKTVTDGYDVSYGTYYYDGTDGHGANHAITIVGWDDNYSKDNFVKTPSADGAWLCLNSYGSEDASYAQKGLFWMSYEDAGLLSEKVAVGYSLSAASNYDNIYQYDGSCSSAAYEGKRFIQFFDIGNTEDIKAVSFGTQSANTTFKAGLYKLNGNISDYYDDLSWVNDVLKGNPYTDADGNEVISAEKLGEKESRTSFAGYYTVDMSDTGADTVKPGDTVAVVLDFDAKTQVYVDYSMPNATWKFVTDTDPYNGLVSVDGTNVQAVNDKESLRIKLFTDNHTDGAPAIAITAPESAVDIQDNTVMIQAKISGISNPDDYEIAYSCSTDEFLSVSTTGLITPKKVGGPTEVTAVLKNKNDTVVASDTREIMIVSAPKSITLPKTETLSLNETKKLKVSYEPDTADLTGGVWESSDPDTVSVDKDGNVKGRAYGSAKITCRVGNVISNECTITVGKSYTGVKLDKETLTLRKGRSGRLTAENLPQGNTEKADYKWKSSDPSKVSVDDTGKVTALDYGRATITVKIDGTNYTDSCVVTVTGQMTGVELNKHETAVMKGKKTQLVAQALPKDTTDPVSFTWESNDPSIATVDTDGNVEGISFGTAVIKVTCGGFTDTCTVYVTGQVSAINLLPSSVVLPKGGTQQITVSLEPAEVAGNPVVTLTSSNGNVAEVNDAGTITAKGVGSCTITAEYSGLKAECRVIVDALDIRCDDAVVSSVTLKPGQSKNLVAAWHVQGSDEIPSVRWKSSNTSVASVDSDGTVSGLKKGTAVVTASTADGKFTKTVSISVSDDTSDTPDVPADDVSISVTNASSFKNMTEGQSLKLSVSYAPAGLTDVKLSFASSDADVAQVSEAGLVTAKKAGTASVTVTLASKEGTAKKVVPVTVKEKGEVPDVPTDTSGYTVAVSNREQLKGLETGETRKAEFVLKDKNGNVVEGAEFVYEADGVYASINGDGMLTAIKAGTAVVNVTAYVNGKKVCEKNVYVSVQVGTGDKKEDVSPSPSPSPSDDPGEADDPAVSPSPKPSKKPASDAAKPSGGTEKTVYVKRIGLSAEVSQIAYTGKLQVSAKIYPDNADNKNVSWTSSNPKWASVDKDGVVKAKKAGKGKSVIITCKALDGSGSSASYTVSITKGAVKKLKITQKENRKTLNIGKKLKLEPKFTFSGNKKDVIKKVAWSSSNEEWASVGKNGVVKAYEEGLGHTVTITARALDMSGKTASYKIRIVKSVVTDIKVSTDSKREVYAGDKIRLKTDLTWTGREKDVDKSIVWSSSNEEWATVNDKGVVITKKAGGGHTVVISAAAKSGVTGTFKVKILASKVTGVTITPVKANTIKAGTKLKLKTTVKTSAKYEDANTKLKWSSSDPKVATVSKNGVVKAKKAGRVTITASSTDGSRVKAKIKLKVIKK